MQTDAVLVPRAHLPRAVPGPGCGCRWGESTELERVSAKHPTPRVHFGGLVRGPPAWRHRSRTHRGFLPGVSAGAWARAASSPASPGPRWHSFQVWAPRRAGDGQDGHTPSPPGRSHLLHPDPGFSGCVTFLQWPLAQDLLLPTLEVMVPFPRVGWSSLIMGCSACS